MPNNKLMFITNIISDSNFVITSTNLIFSLWEI